MAKIKPITKRFYIGQLGGKGLQNDLRPYAIPDDAFASLNNAYVFRGRVRKRFGGQLMQGSTAPIAGLEQIQSRLKINLGNTNGSGNFSGTVPGAIFDVGQSFSVGSEFFTVYQTGTPGVMLTTGASSTHTYNTSTGAVVIDGAAATTAVYFYPAQPVMGIGTYETDVLTNEMAIAFDTQFAYQFTGNGWVRLGTAVWTGTNYDFFWTTNWRGSTANIILFFVSNYNTGTTLSNSDPMYYWDGSSWNAFQPGFNSGTATDTILSARIILPFKDRLVLLNVVENTGDSPGTNATYVNRCRFSWNGDPTDSSAFYEDVAGSGGYIDAPTKEAIITAQFLKDRLIVFFENSTWELAYTGNQVLPFVWQKINTELGAESTFSEVPFDKVVIGIGNVGIHACTGNNVERIDSKIPDEVFKFHNGDDGPMRVAGIRDYYTEMVYWTFPNENDSASFPFNDRVLTYNYATGAWAFNEDSITAFGYFQNDVAGDLSSLEWGQASIQWQDANFQWQSATTQSSFRNIIAGNQEGYIFVVAPDVSSNCPALQITNMAYVSNFTATLTVINHNLSVGDFVKVLNCVGVTALNRLIFVVDSVTDNNTIVLNTFGTAITGTYSGAGTLTRVTPVNFETKQFNFFANQGRNTYISKVDFLVDRTSDAPCTETDSNGNCIAVGPAGQCTVDFMVSSAPYGMVYEGQLTGSILGTNVLETSPYLLVPYESQQDRLWHTVYFQGDGEYIQFNFYLTPEQIINPLTSECDFQLHAMLIHAQPTSSRLQ